MNFRRRRIDGRLDTEWHISNMSDIASLLLYPRDSIEVRLPCEHKDTSVNNGIRKCLICGDILEIIPLPYRKIVMWFEKCETGPGVKERIKYSPDSSIENKKKIESNPNFIRWEERN